MNWALRVAASLAALMFTGLGAVCVDLIVKHGPSEVSAVGWLLTFVSLAVGLASGWIAVSGRTRPCPVCAVGVRKGRWICPSCGFDFRTLVGLADAPPQQPAERP